MRIAIAVVFLIVIVKCIANKIASMALLMYLQDHGNIPNEEEIKAYTSRAVKKFFHMPS
ncbi:MAG: hypothetical protein NC489_25555 [Ruminococcus flavefaciens]|nr:hypothetical protein [Ruminococcus flavefaciens]